MMHISQYHSYGVIDPQEIRWALLFGCHNHIVLDSRFCVDILNSMGEIRGLPRRLYPVVGRSSLRFPDVNLFAHEFKCPLIPQDKSSQKGSGGSVEET